MAATDFIESDYVALRLIDFGAQAMRLTRRRLLRLAAGISVGGAASTAAYAMLVEPHWVEYVRRPLPIRDLPASLAGCTLVQISDIHVGTQVDEEYLLSTFRQIAALAPDIVAFTGDFIGYHPRVFEQLPRVLDRFPRGRLATLATLGNHDYGPGWSHADIAARVVEMASASGIPVLRNEVRAVEGLQIAGLDDMWGTFFKPEQTIAAIDRTRPALVLSHNPDTADLPVWLDYRGWILSGHTHGGQCKPPFLPPPLVPVRNKRYTAGEFMVTGDRSLYINRGLGHLIQVRFNVRPEVTIFQLRS